MLALAVKAVLVELEELGELVIVQPPEQEEVEEEADTEIQALLYQLLMEHQETQDLQVLVVELLEDLGVMVAHLLQMLILVVQDLPEGPVQQPQGMQETQEILVFPETLEILL